MAVKQQTLFRTSIKMTSNFADWDYFLSIFLTLDSTFVSEFEKFINLREVGLKRFLFRLSRDNPLDYRILALAIAIAASWLTAAIFQVVLAH